MTGCQLCSLTYLITDKIMPMPRLADYAALIRPTSNRFDTPTRSPQIAPPTAEAADIFGIRYRIALAQEALAPPCHS